MEGVKGRGKVSIGPMWLSAPWGAVRQPRESLSYFAIFCRPRYLSSTQDPSTPPFDLPANEIIFARARPPRPPPLKDSNPFNLVEILRPLLSSRFFNRRRMNAWKYFVRNGVCMHDKEKKNFSILFVKRASWSFSFSNPRNAKRRNYWCISIWISRLDFEKNPLRFFLRICKILFTSQFFDIY